MRHPAAVRSLGGVLRLLDERGHSVHVAFGVAKTGGSHRVLQELAADCRRLTFDRLPGPAAAEVSAARGWSRVARNVRLTADALRYLDARYDEAPSLRRRGLAKAPPAARRLVRAAGVGGRPGTGTVRAAVSGLERSLPVPAHVQRYVADRRPDVVVATHLNEWASPDADYLRAAGRLGIHSAYVVFSWDNLTNKGLVRGEPELVLVWNDLQVAEAVELHGSAPERVRVTGAHAYDHWFDWRPSTSRAELCERVGLRADRPIVLYVCSSRFIAPEEVAFVRRWATALRAYGGELADAGLLVRPHPQNAAQWRGAELDDPQVRVWPRLGEEPIGREARNHYFDSIHHAAAVVGINTSAQIESAIVDRPVHTILADDFRGAQDGTLHFRYLHADDFGHLHVAATLEEHAELLAASLRGAGGDLNARFLRRFVRPFGLDVPASPLCVEALEELARRPAPAPGRQALAPAGQLLLRPAAALAARRAPAVRPDRAPSPARSLRRSLQALLDESPDAPVVAGPWTGDEIGELLYWIPFLAWAEAATSGLRERLVVVARGEAAPWYAGLGSRLVTSEQGVALADTAGIWPATLPPAMIGELRETLAVEHPGFQRRLLGFARVPVPEPPEGPELPTSFVAAAFGPEDGEAALGVLHAIVEQWPVVVLGAGNRIRAELGEDARVTIVDAIDRGVETAVVARARALVGSYGVLPYLASLLGRPAVALLADPARAAPGDLRLAADFLSVPPYGPLRVVKTGGEATSAAGRVVALLEENGVSAVEPLAPQPG
ncbi:MAG TPA: hypothetical protein VH760_02280 [Gaiellaceae bacterium]